MRPSAPPGFTPRITPDLDAMLMRIQNDCFDLGADLATPDTGEKLDYEPLRIVDAQVDRIEADIDAPQRRSGAAQVLCAAWRDRSSQLICIWPAPWLAAPNA
jgi:cob(I)alamin adenosyltransferase